MSPYPGCRRRGALEPPGDFALALGLPSAYDKRVRFEPGRPEVRRGPEPRGATSLKLNTPKRVRDWRLYKRTTRAKLIDLSRAPGLILHARFFKEFDFNDRGRPLCLFGRRSEVDPITAKLVTPPAGKKDDPNSPAPDPPVLSARALCHYRSGGDVPMLVVRVTRGKIRDAQLKRLLRQIGLNLDVTVTSTDEE